MAGINAHQKIQDKHELVFKKDRSHTLGVFNRRPRKLKALRKPYRMFTSRAEHRFAIKAG